MGAAGLIIICGAAVLSFLTIRVARLWRESDEREAE
jgi:hypothetical protein